MLRTDKEYAEAQKRLEDDRVQIERQREELKSMGLPSDELEFAMQPLISFHEQLREEVEWYEKVKQGHFESITDLQCIGQILIGLRIFTGITQKQLAELLSVSEAMVSRDERNEYHGITVERAQRILEALKAGVELKVTPVATNCSY